MAKFLHIQAAIEHLTTQNPTARPVGILTGEFWRACLSKTSRWLLEWRCDSFFLDEKQASQRN